MKDTTNRPYFQFPIMLLRIGKKIDAATKDEVRKAVDNIINWCVGNLAEKTLEHHEDDFDGLHTRYLVAMETMSGHCRTWDGGEEDDDYAMAVCVTLETLGMLSSRHMVDMSRKAYDGTNTTGSMLVRVRGDIVWDVYEDRMPWRDFAVLCAVYAKIGDKKMSQVTRDDIRALACGYNSMKAVPYATKKYHLLSVDKVRWTLDKLAERGLFRRATVCGRRVYFSHRLSMTELETAVGQKVATKSRGRAVGDQKQRIKAKIAAITNGSE